MAAAVLTAAPLTIIGAAARPERDDEREREREEQAFHTSQYVRRRRRSPRLPNPPAHSFAFSSPSLRRGWSQQQLADRLSELLTGPPPEMFEKDDPRRKAAEHRTAPTTLRKWTQTRVAKLERGALKCVSIDDVLELALGLDAPPLALMTPTLEPQGSDRAKSWSLLRPGPDDTFRVWLGGNIVRWPREVRQWIRGVNPLLHSGAYKTDDEAWAGQLFYFVESQPLGEVRLIEEGGDYAKQMRAMRKLLTPAKKAE